MIPTESHRTAAPFCFKNLKKSNLKNILFQSVFLNIAFIVSFPHVCQADAINPLFNLFTPDTIVPASILTVLIILVEALLLWKWIKPISLRLSLWRATIINIISSAAGSMAAWLFFKEQMIWGMMGLYIPMFFLTLATETPTLKFLYRREGFSWARSIKVSFGINIISYLFVFVAQYGLIFAYLGFADFADKQTINKWNDASLLEGETGFIYTVKFTPTEKFIKYVFNRYDVENKRWEIVDPGFERGIHPAVWDVKGNIISCIIETGDREHPHISVLNATTFSKLIEIEGNFRETRISPDLSMLAVFEYVREINAPRDNESDFILGSACQLKIYDLKSGSLLYKAPRLTLNLGLAWTKNSTDIIFSSLRDKSLFQKHEGETHSHTYGRAYAKSGQFPIDLCIYNLKKNIVKRLIEGQGPYFISSKNEISFLRESGFYNRDLWQLDIEQGKPRLVLSDIGGYEQAVSPSGSKYLILVPHKQPLGSSFFLTVVDANDTERKFIVEPNSNFGFRWIPK